MALTSKDFERFRQQAEQQAKENAANFKFGDTLSQPQVAAPNEYKAWTDLFGNVNMSNLTTGETERYFQHYGAPTKRASKDSIGEDLNQAVSGAVTRQGANYRSALGTLGLGLAGLVHGDNNYQPEVGSTLWKLIEGGEAGTKAANAYMEDSKKGRGAIGSFAMDLTTGAVDLIGDQVMNLVVPGSGFAAMGVRSFGGGAEDSRQQGKSISTQFLKGLKSAAVEVATEKMWQFGGVGAGGEGFAQGLLDRGFANVAKRGGNVFLTKLGMAFGTEAIEEMASDILNPLADRVIAGIVRGDYDVEEMASIPEILYDGLIGGALGLLGGTSEGIQAQQQLRSIGQNEQGVWKYGLGLEQDMADKRDASLMKKAVAWGVFKDGVQKTIDKLVPNRGNAASPETLQNAATEPLTSDQQSTPEAAPLTPDVASPEFNSNVEAATTEETAEPVQSANPQVTNPQVDAKVEAQPQEASTVAAQPQEGQDNGGTVSDSQPEGRQDVSSEVRPGETGDSEASETLRGRQSDGSGTVDVGTSDKGKAERLKEHSERAARLTNAIEKRSKGASSKVRESILDGHANDMMADDDLVQFISDNAKDNGAALYTDMLISSLVEKGDRGEIFSILREAGMDRETADQTLDEVFGKKAETKSDEDDLPFTFGSEEKPESSAKTDIQAGKLRITTENGKRVATVSDTTGKKPHIGKDVDTVRVAQKYKRQKGDILKRGRNGYKIVQHGNTDNYTVIDRRGNVVGNYTSFESASKATGNKGGVFNVALFNLGDSIVKYNSGYCELDTDTAFTDADYLTTQGRSLMSEDLGILHSRHGRMGYTGNTTTDVVNVEIDVEDFLRKAKQNPKYAKYKESFLRKLWADDFNVLLHGKKNDYGEYVRLPGIWGKNGKHYVFAGWTASKSRKGVAIFMEEGKYKQFRHRMVGGLSPSEVKNFNPSKYMTNQGTYYTPSEANTGVKCGNLIVMADIMNIYHEVTRMFIRSSDLDSDIAALKKAGLTEEAAKAKLNSVKAGESFMLTGDLIVNTVDGMGFVDSQLLKGHDFQARGPGGLKGFLLNCDFKGLFNDNIPVDPDRAFTITDPETGEVIAGIRHVSKEKGVEVMNKWGKWQAINESQGIVFESMVKFKDNYTVYKDVDGKQVIDPDASTEKFKKAMADIDLRSIPIENAFGRSWDEDSDETGRIKGYTRRTLSQMTRSVDGLPETFAEALITEGFENPVRQVLQSPEDFLRAIGVSEDGTEMPAGGDAIAYIAAAYPDAFVNSNLGKKMAYDLVIDLAEKARGGQLYLKNSEHAYQYMSPDPFGLLNLMTQFQTQMQDAVLGSTAAMKKSDNPLFDFALKGNREAKNKYTGERYQGEIYSSKLEAGETMAARNPNNELTDSQLRQNVRNKIYEDMLAKYGFGTTAAFFALNDTLALNMDNDYDGDTAFLFQKALAKALKKAQMNLGKSKNEKGRVVKNWELFTERGSSKGKPADVSDFDVIIAAVKQALNAPDIATMDRFINIVDELPNSWLSEIGKSKRELAALFSTAYKASYDFAKDGKFDPEFAQSVVDAQVAIINLLEKHGYYTSYEVVERGQESGKDYTYLKAYFLPALARYEFSPNAKKREEVRKAWEKYDEFLKKDGKKAKKTVLDPGDALISQFYKNKMLSDIAPGEREEAERDYGERMNFIEELFPWKNGKDEFDYRTLSAIAPASYSGTDPDIWYKLGRYYTEIVNKAGSYDAMRESMSKLYSSLSLDPVQFESLMSMALFFSDHVNRYSSSKLFLNFDQCDGSTPVTEIIKSKMRIAGTLNRLEKAINGINEELREVIKPYQDAKKYYESLVATRSDELDLKRELQQQMAELDSEAAWLTDLLNKFQFSQKTFQDRVSRNSFVAAMMGQEEELRRFSEKVKQTSERLDALENDAVSKYFLTEDSKAKIRELNKQVRDARKAMNDKVDNTLLAIQMLNEAKEEYENRFEETETKKWLYGYDRIGETGIDTERQQVEMLRKLDLLMVLSGGTVTDDILRPETAAFIDRHLLGLVDKTPNAGQSINGEAKGWVYHLKRDAAKGVPLWIENNHDTMMNELGIDLSNKVTKPSQSQEDVFKAPPPSNEPTTYEYKQGVRKESNADSAKKTPPPNPPKPPEPPKPPKPSNPTKNESPREPERPAPQQKPEPKPAPEPAVEEQQAEKKEPVPPEATYGIRFDRVKEAVDSIGKSFGDGAKAIVPDSSKAILGEKFAQARHDLYNFGRDVVNAFSASDDGASLVNLAKELTSRARSSDALTTLLGKDENSNAFKAAKRLAETEGAKNPLAFQNAAAEFAEILAKESAEFKNTVETISQWKQNIEKRGKFTKFLVADNALSRTLSMFFGYQRDFINIAMGLDNFRKKANGAGYRLAQAIMDGEFAGVNVMGNALDIAIKAKKAWDASEASKKTVELSFIKDKQRETHTVSAALAVDFLHTLETLERSKIDAWNNVIYLVGDERIRMTSKEQYLSVKEALEKAVLKDEAAKAYYDSFSEGYALFKDPSKSAVKNASGRTVEMYEDGSYYPISTNATGKAGPKDYNFGMDDAMYTKSRIKIDGGIINVFDPSVRFNSYVNMATKVVSRAEVGATLERLNRGGIVESLEDIVTERYGKGHTDVVKQMIKDSNDFRADSDEVSSFLRTLRLNIQTGALFGNFGSMLKQYPSVFNSVGVLDFDDVIYGMSRIVGKNEEKAKASAVGAIRSRYQNFDPDVKDAFDNDTAFNKFFKNIQKKAPWLAVFSDGFQRIDSNAIKTIYIAARHNVLKRGISESDPDFENKVMELFKPAFLLTQPQFDKMMRPYVQTSQNEWIRMFGMFKTQPLRNFNTMIRAVEEFKAVKNDKSSTAEEISNASNTLAKTIAGQATASLMFGVLGVLSKLVYHRRKDLEDEEGKLDAGMMLTRALLDAIEVTSGMVVFGDSASKFAIDLLSGGKTKEFYNVNAGTISSIKSAVDDLTKFAEQPGLAKGRQLATDLSTLFGIPLSNAYAIVNSAIMYTRDWTGSNENRYQDIMKALDAEAKAAKKAEEKAAKSGKSDGAALLADTAKANAPESDLNSAGETIDSGVSRNLTKPYNALTEAGMSDEESKRLMSFIDMDGNGNLKQAELIAFYKDNPDYEAYAEAMWNSYGWKTTWESAKKKAGK